MFFFNDTATTEIYTLSLHDALPICRCPDPTPGETPRCPRGGEAREAGTPTGRSMQHQDSRLAAPCAVKCKVRSSPACERSEEHTSELQSRQYLACRLLLEKKNVITP